MFIFIAADMINIGRPGACKAMWLIYPVAAFLAVPFYSAVSGLFSGGGSGISRALSVPLGLYGALVLAGIFGQLSLFVATNNDFAMSPRFVAALMAVTSLVLARLRGNGFERYVDIAFGGIAALLAAFIVTNVGGWKLGRLLPLLEDTPRELAKSLGTAFFIPFAQGFMAMAVIGGRTERDTLRRASGAAAIGAALALSLEHMKSVCAVGYEVASLYTFPAYAVASVQYSNTYGPHIEEVLMCAIIAGMIVKSAMLMRFCAACVGRVTKRPPGAAVYFLITAGALLLGTEALGKSAALRVFTELSVWPAALLCALAPLVYSAAAWVRAKAGRIK